MLTILHCVNLLSWVLNVLHLSILSKISIDGFDKLNAPNVLKEK